MIVLIAMLAAALVQSPLAAAADWRIVPLTPGSWTYRAFPGGSEAVFTSPRGAATTAAIARLILRCDQLSRQVTIINPAIEPASPPPIALRILTTSAERRLPVTGTIAGSDRLLDAIAFSRGRFAIQAMDALPLVVPAWPEPARTIEDCRK